MAHSSAARAGMGALTRTLAMEWGRYGIGLVCVAPGWIDTEGVRGYGLDLDEVAATIPMQRLGGADEVGDLIAYLASPAAAYITGQTIAIDGGVDLTSSGWELPHAAGRSGTDPLLGWIDARDRLDRRAHRPAGRAGLPGRPWPCHRARPRARAREAGAARGRGRRRQDRGGEGACAGHGRAPDPPAVLRGHRRRPRPVRLEPRPPAALHPHAGGRRCARPRADAARPVRPRVSRAAAAARRDRARRCGRRRCS